VSETEEQTAASLDEREVAEFLRRNPDFFRRHEAVLEAMNIPHRPGAGAASLLERQVTVLRARNAELTRRLGGLAQTARTNEALLGRLQVLLLRLVSATDLDDLLRRLDAGLRDEFHADFVVIRLFAGERPEAIAPDAPLLAPLARELQRREPVCGYLTPEQREALFGPQAGEVASAIFVPLCEGRSPCAGLLAVGSVDPKRFHPEMGTVFVAHLGAVVARLLTRLAG
jgi:uncharacterized protein YigA (DUF484 family)